MRGLAVLLLLAGCDVIWDLDHVEAIDAPVDLVAYFPLDDVTDGHVVDLVGDASGECTASLCPIAIDGVVDGALLFDGTSTLVHSPSSAALDAKGSFTLSVWVRIDAAAFGSENSCAISKLLGFDDLDTWQLCVTAENWYLWTATTAIGIQQIVGPPADYGNWHQFVVTWESATLGMRLYYDGGAVGAEMHDIDFDTGAILIGADSDRARVGGWFRGAVDELRIYDRAFSVSEVAALNSGSM